MTYLVMARKYRPSTFDEVVGQTHVTTTLKNAIQTNRISHAYLFTGPRGTGKTTVARILAKALNCKEGPTPQPCNHCDSCKEIAIGRSLDVMEIDGASNNSVDDIRALRENIRYVPSQARYKVYIIDEVHMLSDSAFNALLKTLEEPPAHAIFIFATTEPHKLPQTVLSRCQRFDFRRIPITDLVKTIKDIAEKENLEIEKEASYILARRADGSLRDLLSLLDQVIAYGNEGESQEGGRRSISSSLIAETLGLVNQDKLFEITDAIGEKDTSKGILILNQLMDSGIDLPEFVNSLLQHLRDLLIAKVSGNSNVLFDLSDIYIEKYKEKSSAFTEIDLLRMIRMLADLNMDLKRASDPRILLEMTLMKMLKMESSVDLSELLSKLELLKNCPSPGMAKPGNTTSGDSFKPKVSSSPPEKPITRENSAVVSEETKAATDIPVQPDSFIKTEVLSLGEIQRRWSEVLGEVKNNKLSLWSLIKDGELVGLEDDTLTIEFGNGNSFHKNQAEKRENLNLIQKALGGIFTPPLKLKFELNQLKGSSPSESGNTKSDTGAGPARIAEDPLIKSILDNFEGEIIR
jgi:DNA polymerase III subunit gamma/tau